MSEHLKPIVEALIFASPEPVTPKTLYKLLDGETREDVDAALAAVRADYDAPRGLQLVEVAGGYQITTRPELHEWVRKLFHDRTTQKLSVQALETLAVIAYKQPVTSAEIAEIRGVTSSGGVLTTLVERRLIKTVGRKQVVGRPFMYATTREFLERFGLGDLSDLPKVEELSDALGFELPPQLSEPTVTTSPLPFDAESAHASDDDATPANRVDTDSNEDDPGGDVPEGLAAAESAMSTDANVATSADPESAADDSELEAGEDGVAGPDADADADAGAEPDEDADADAEDDGEFDDDDESDEDDEVESDDDTDLEAGQDADADADADAGAGADRRFDADDEGGSGADADSGVDTVEAESGADEEAADSAADTADRGDDDLESDEEEPAPAGKVQ